MDGAPRIRRPAAMMCSTLKRNLDDVSFSVRGLPDEVGGSSPVLLRRLDLDDLVLLGTLSVLGCLKHHDALATDEVFWTPPELGVYLPSDGHCPLVRLGLRAGRHTGEADYLGVLSSNLERPHQPDAELGLLLLDVHHPGVVGAVLEDFLYLHVHPKTQLLVSFEPVDSDSWKSLTLHMALTPYASSEARSRYSSRERRLMRTARPTRAALTSPALRSFHNVVLDSPDSSSACLYVTHSRVISACTPSSLRRWRLLLASIIARM